MSRIFYIVLSFFIFQISFAAVFSLNHDTNFPFVNENVSKVFYDKETNKLYIGGNFQNIRYYTGSSALYNINDHSLITPWPRINGQVYTIISDGNGGWYVGGDFQSVDNIEIKNLVHILSNGEIDQDFIFNFEGEGYGYNGYINALLINSSTLYIGGSFDKINGQTRNNLAAIDLISKSLIDWSPQVEGVIFSLAKSSTTLYVGGDFSSINNFPRDNLAAFNLSDHSLISWQPQISGLFLPSIYSLVVSSSTLYVGGSFEEINNQSRKNLAAFDLSNDESNPQLTDWSPQIEGEVYAMTVSEEKIYIYGNFTANNGEINNLAAINVLTAQFDNWRPEKEISTFLPYGSINVINENIYVGGMFDILNNDSPRREIIGSNFAVFNKNNGWLIDFHPDFEGQINSIANDNQKIYIGGYFDTVIKEKKKYLTIFSSLGEILPLSLISDNETISGDIYEIEKIDNRIFVSGRFDFDPRSGGPSELYFVKIFDQNNNEIYQFNTDGPVSSITAVSSTVYFAGNFNQINGQSVNNIAAIDKDTYQLLDNDSLNLINNESEYFNFINYLDPYLFIAGKFSKINALNSNESKSRLFVINLTNNIFYDIQINGNVKSILKAGRYIYVGGNFNQIMGNNRKYFATLEINDGGFISLSEKLKNFVPDNYVNDLKIIGSNIYLVGSFNNINNVPRNRIAAINLETEQLLNWNPIVNGSVSSLDFSSSSLFIGGSFYEINSTTVYNLARFDRLLSPQISNIKLNNTYNNNSTLPANTNQVTLTFNTDKNAICRYSTTANTSFDNMTNNITTNNGLSHSTTFSNLQNNTSYTYYLRCQDATNPDLKNTEDYVVNFSIAQVTTGSSGGGGGGFTGGGGGGGSRVISPSTTTTTSDEALRLWLLQFVNQLLSQKQTATSPQKQTTITPTFKSKIKGIPDGFQFTRTLKFGMKGQDVKYLQIFLRAQGENIKITGNFDEETRQAVINFQEKLKDDILTPQKLTKGTGVVASSTIKKINDILTGETVVSSRKSIALKNKTDNSSKKSTLFPSTTTTNTSTINTTDNFNLSSNFNDNQKQSANIIQQLLSQQLALIFGPEAIPKNYRFNRILSFGMKGQDVKYLQIFLRAQGENIKITGNFDEETRQAVINFQEKHKLEKINGIVDQPTLKKINQLLGF
ncbi:MAG: hypothetical protein KatS3mg095_0617 [Candidatus Parcubacteria bacterium]|nr:MAG: hypothetical protein KatS3mg095_0617 [Candidatus Parcubacteria bacterium]